jgi:hypothetical protein
MTVDRNATERFVVDAGWVDLPDDLRDRVVMAATAAAHESDRAGWFDRIWYSTRWRVAAGVALLALALLNAFATRTDTDTSDRFGRTAYEAAEDARLAARQLGLPNAACRGLGEVALVAASHAAPADEVPDKEYGK